MSSTRPTVRSLLLLYLLMGVPGWMNLMYVPGAVLAVGDATTTARNIAAAETLYRFGILAGVVSNVAFLFLALALYDLFSDVDRKQARLLVTMVLMSAAIGLVNLVLQIAPLVFVPGAKFLAVFPKPQLDALAYGFLRLYHYGNHVDMVFWGLWLLPFGVLVIRSGFIPKWIGVLLIVGCFAYLIVSVTAILLPAQRALMFRILLPFYGAGELSMIGWLLVKSLTPGFQLRTREEVRA
jgi:hypothetical protein